MAGLDDPLWLVFYLIFSFPVILFAFTRILIKFDKSFRSEKKMKRLVYMNSVSVISWVVLVFFIEVVVHFF